MMAFIDKIIAVFFSIVTAVISLFYTPTTVPAVNPETLPEPAMTQKITVMSFNVYIGGAGELSAENRTDEVVSKIRSHSPDSFGLQEANEGWMERLPEILKDEYAYVGVGRDRDLGGEASPVFYKKDKYEVVEYDTFWLSKTPEKPSKGWDAMFNRICTYAVLKDKETGFTYAHFNAHFDHMGVVARNESVTVIANKIKEIAPDMPVVFSGDLNDGEDTDMYARVLESGMKDTRSLAENSGTDTTFHAYAGSERTLDYIFANAFCIKVDKHLVDNEMINGIYASDHHPVVATLELFN